jgi:hypothetical protein
MMMRMIEGASSILNEHARQSIQGQLKRVAYLRATGPNPFDYWVWADYTRSTVAQAFGARSAEAEAFDEAVRERGRTLDQRGIADNMTLGLHGEWGIWARLDRGQSVLEQIIEGAPFASFSPNDRSSGTP